MDGTIRKNISPGKVVEIVLKQDQRSGRLTRGVGADLLTKSSQHPHGLRVRVAEGQVGRVKNILEQRRHGRA